MPRLLGPLLVLHAPARSAGSARVGGSRSARRPWLGGGCVRKRVAVAPCSTRGALRAQQTSPPRAGTSSGSSTRLRALPGAVEPVLLTATVAGLDALFLTVTATVAGLGALFLTVTDLRSQVAALEAENRAAREAARAEQHEHTAVAAQLEQLEQLGTLERFQSQAERLDAKLAEKPQSEAIEAASTRLEAALVAGLEAQRATWEASVARLEAAQQLQAKTQAAALERVETMLNDARSPDATLDELFETIVRQMDSQSKTIEAMSAALERSSSSQEASLKDMLVQADKALAAAATTQIEDALMQEKEQQLMEELEESHRTLLSLQKDALAAMAALSTATRAPAEQSAPQAPEAVSAGMPFVATVPKMTVEAVRNNGKVEPDTNGVSQPAKSPIPTLQRPEQSQPAGSRATWKRSDWKKSFEHPGNGQRGVGWLAFSPTCTQLVMGSDDMEFRVWQPREGEREGWEVAHVLDGGLDPALSGAFSPNGDILVATTFDATKVWDTTSWQETRELMGQQCCTFSPCGRLLATGSHEPDGVIRLWSTDTFQEVGILIGHEDSVWCLAFSHSGEHLVSASKDNTVRIWDTSTWEAVETLDEHETIVSSVQFSPNDKLMISAGEDGEIVVWDTATWEMVTALEVPCNHGVPTCAFTPCGSKLVVGSDDDLSTWSMKKWSKEEVFDTKVVDDSNIWCCLFSDDGSYLATGSDDGSLHIWQHLTS